MALLMAAGQSAPGGLMLRGRRDECATLDRLLDGANAGRSGTLVLRGEAGVGKTALLDYAVDSASDLTVLHASGVESEMELAFAALHQLCGPLLDRLDRLPRPQRDALEVTFGLTEGLAPDRFFVGLAVLGLLAEAAAERPLLCVIDDAQWLDRASAQAFSFVARRLRADSVVMLFAARERSDETAGLPELVLGGLRGGDARALLASVIPGRLDERIADELLAETGGNPLALLELPRGLTAGQLAGGFGLPAALSLSGRIEESFQQRLEGLPEDTRRLLRVAAADPTGDPNLLWRAIDRLGLADAAVEPAESAGLIVVDTRVWFRHPLVRSAVYGAASPEERREAHGALADATDARVDPDRRAWHFAEAAAGADEGVAVELEQAAGRAQARGGPAAAAAFLERAAALTPEPIRRGERALAAAQTKYEAGALDDALALLGTAEAGPADDAQRARVRLLRAQIAFASKRGGDAPELLLRAARDLESIDPKLARSTYLEALAATMFAGRLGPGAVEISEAALAGAAPPQPPGPSDLLLQGLAVRFTDGPAAAAPILKEALRAFRGISVLPPEEARWLWFASWIAIFLFDDDAWTELSTRHLELVREAGALTALPFVLANRSSVYAFFGDLDAAAACEEELKAATEATGIATVPYGALALAALGGDEAELGELTATTRSDAQARGEGLALTITEFLGATLYLGLGRYDAALAAVGQAERYHEEGAVTWALIERIEAAVRSGQPQLAGAAMARVTEATRASGTEWARSTEARCSALLSEGDAVDTDELYHRAIAHSRSTRLRVHLARAHLLYGEWLRRERRRLDAREHLRTAFEMFNAMGIEGFAARAERELLATGEHARRRSVETRGELTPQEAHVARLARDGLSNVEIGARLFISQHTVAYHLRKVFTKLGVTSRNQLAGALSDSDAVGQVA